MQRWEREMARLQVSTEAHQRRHAQGEQLQELLRRYQELRALQPTTPH